VFAQRVGERVFGKGNVITDHDPVMGGEDFSYMLLERPGAYVFLGQGGGPHNCFLHNPNYDFNDEVIPLGAGYLAALVEDALPLKYRSGAWPGGGRSRRRKNRSLPSACAPRWQERRHVTEKRMFGGTCFLLRATCSAARAAEIFLFRVGKDAHAAAIKRRGAKAMVHGGRRMEGFIWVDPAVCDARRHQGLDEPGGGLRRQAAAKEKALVRDRNSPRHRWSNTDPTQEALS
jgi:hypothetical protein